MGDVVQFNSNKEKRRRITFEDFQRSLKSNEVRTRCLEIFAREGAPFLFKADAIDVSLTHIETGTALPERYKFGLCSAFLVNTGAVDKGVAKKHITTYFNEEFPNYLHSQTDLGVRDATELAASYTLALNGLLSDNAQYLRSRRTTLERIRSTRHSSIWEEGVLRAPLMKVVVPAAAGFVALEDTDFANDGMDFSDQYPYPSHIAGLADPVNRTQFRELVQRTIIV